MHRSSAPKGFNHKGLPVNVVTRCLIISLVTDTLLSLTVGGMHTHLTSTHLTYTNTCVPRATDDVQIPYLRWKCMQCMSYKVADMLSTSWLLMQMCNKWTRQRPWGTNEWLQFVRLPKPFFCASSLYETSCRELWDRFAVHVWIHHALTMYRNSVITHQSGLRARL